MILLGIALAFILIGAWTSPEGPMNGWSVVGWLMALLWVLWLASREPESFE